MDIHRRVVGYARVSTEEQADEGLSLDAQETKLINYVAMRGLELVTVVKDPGVSASRPMAERRGGRRLLTLVGEGDVRGVVAWKLDRLFRDCADCLLTIKAWDSQGVALHLVDMGGQAVDTSSAMGRFFLTVMAGAAELEHAQIRERTRLAMRYKASRWEYLGGPPRYGFRLAANGTHVEPDPHETEAVQLAQDLRCRGASLLEIAESLTRQGYLTRKGKAFAPSQVRRLLDGGIPYGPAETKP